MQSLTVKPDYALLQPILDNLFSEKAGDQAFFYGLLLSGLFAPASAIEVLDAFAIRNFDNPTVVKNVALIINELKK